MKLAITLIFCALAVICTNIAVISTPVNWWMHLAAVGCLVVTAIACHSIKP